MQLQIINSIVVVCTVLSGKELHRQVGVGKVMSSGSLGGEMVSTLERSARDVGSTPALSTIVPIFIIPTKLVPWPGSCWTLHEPTLYIR